jgi:hypothetical protein
MNVNTWVELLFPVLLLVVQSCLLLQGTVFILKRLHFLRLPLTDIEIGSAVFCSAVFFSVFLISSASFAPLLQSFKTFRTQGLPIYSALFFRFGQYFLIVIGASVVFALLVLLVIKFIFQLRKPSVELRDGNAGLGIVAGAVVVNFGMLTYFAVGELMDYITPKVVIFN